MTEAVEDGSHLVRVRAQVMMRDDSTGGWVPLGGGGLSHVSVRKRKIHHEDDQPCKHEYLIVGKRISDQTVVLSCTIKKDFEYNKVMPTFHHWKTGNKKFGLTFQTAADARAFDKGVRVAVEDLLDGLSETETHQINLDVGEDDVFMQLELPVDRGDSASSAGSSPATGGWDTTGRTGAQTPTNPQDYSYLHSQFGDTHHRINFFPHQLTRSRTIGGSDSTRRSGRGPGPLPPPGDPAPPGDTIDAWLGKLPRTVEKVEHHLHPLGQEAIEIYSGYGPGRPDISSLDNELSYDFLKYSDGPLDKSDAYVKFHVSEEPQYHYPHLNEPLPPGSSGRLGDFQNSERRNSIASLKRAAHLSEMANRLPLPAPANKSDKKRSKKNSKKIKKQHTRLLQERCGHCQELYSEAENKIGSCGYSPDPVRHGIECVSCLSCAKCLLYHCHYEDENFSDEDICTCSDTDGHLTKRWLGLSLLAVLVPCLCLYPVLTACYSCGRACHLCGGKHVPV